MKKTLLIILSAVLALALFSGCAKGDATVEKTLLTFESDNGYSLSYPEEYEPSSLSRDIDFVIMDPLSGSTATVHTKKNAGELTEESFIADMAADGMDIDVESFTSELIGENNATVISYTYNENSITEIVYTSGSKAFFATYTELPGTKGEFRADMNAVLRSLTF